MPESRNAFPPSGDVPSGSGADPAASLLRSASPSPTPFARARRALRGLVVAGVSLGVAFYGACVLLLLVYTVADPLTTGVQIQRRVESWGSDAAYEKRYTPVSLSDVDDDLELAVVAAEDTRFFDHGGIDWEAIQDALDENRDRDDRRRGGSTITQQLVKNLFLTTHSTYVRKGLELPLTYLAEFILSKERILELYLNVIEWGPGVYGIEAAAQYHYDTSAARLGRYRAAALAACIPDPLDRRPARMDWYTRIILRRMNQIGSLRPYLSESASTDARRPRPTTSRASSPDASPDRVPDSIEASDAPDTVASRSARASRVHPAPPDSVRADTSRIAW